jgi:hypothetical protein
LTIAENSCKIVAVTGALSPIKELKLDNCRKLM